MGIGFAAAPEYHVFPTLERPLKPYDAVVRAARETAPLVDAFRPDVVVADILTLAMALAGEVAGVPVATRDPPRRPAAVARLPALLDRGAPAAHGRGPRAVAALRPHRRARARARARPAQRGAAAARPPRAAPRPRRDLGAAVPGGHVPAARVPARVAAGRDARGRAAAVGAALRRRRAAAGRRPARARRPVDLPGRRAPPAARRGRPVSPASTCACSPRGTGGRSRPRSRCLRTPGWSSG